VIALKGKNKNTQYNQQVTVFSPEKIFSEIKIP